LLEVIRWAGVAYLAWMGMTMPRSRSEILKQYRPTQASPVSLVRHATLISLGNLKAIFVWLAVFTQFTTPGAPLGPQLAVVGPSALAAIAIAIAIYVAHCALGFGAGHLFAGHHKRWFDQGAGGLYLIFAAGLATADYRRK
jgi:threonine/homoserine/homoserine lactone efflux protein